MALSLDRQAFVDILSEGKGNVGGAMQPPPGGLWGMPSDVLQTLPGYDPTCGKTALMPARSCKSSVTDRITGSR